jgi:hypothetical protein
MSMASKGAMGFDATSEGGSSKRAGEKTEAVVWTWDEGSDEENNARGKEGEQRR